MESEISWLRERGCYAISIFHADNWKPAGQLSSVCKFALFVSVLILRKYGGWDELMSLPPYAVTIFIIFVARSDRSNNDSWNWNWGSSVLLLISLNDDAD